MVIIIEAGIFEYQHTMSLVARGAFVEEETAMMKNYKIFIYKQIPIWYMKDLAIVNSMLLIVSFTMLFSECYYKFLLNKLRHFRYRCRVNCPWFFY